MVLLDVMGEARQWRAGDRNLVVMCGSRSSSRVGWPNRSADHKEEAEHVTTGTKQYMFHVPTS